MYVIVEYYAHIGQEPVEEQENLIDYVGKNLFITFLKVIKNSINGKDV